MFERDLFAKGCNTYVQRALYPCYHRQNLNYKFKLSRIQAHVCSTHANSSVLWHPGRGQDVFRPAAPTSYPKNKSHSWVCWNASIVLSNLKVVEWPQETRHTHANCQR